MDKEFSESEMLGKWHHSLNSYAMVQIHPLPPKKSYIADMVEILPLFFAE